MPEALRKARSRQRGGPKRGTTPKPKAGKPDMPAHIKKDKDALACWNHLSARLTKLKVLTPADGVAFEGLCQAYSRAMRADRLVSKFGLVQENNLSGRLSANPAVNISRSSWAEVRKFAQEFGLTPSARTRVTELNDAPDGDGDTKENAEDFLFGGSRGKVVGSIGG
jgi:P27 family predicted phage terminase small subunit